MATSRKVSAAKTGAKGTTAVLEREEESEAKESTRLPYKRKFMPVTPVMAKGFLDQVHPDQRHHRDMKVEQYAQDMRRGNWREDTEDAILIDWNGYLIDGQNRLRAVIESGQTIKFWVAWGKDPAVMGVKDTGAARTVADSLRISGRGGGMTSAELSVLGAIARREIHWEAGRRSRGSMKGTGATHSDIAALLDRQPDIYGATKIGIDASKASKLVNAATYGFFWLHANRVHGDKAYQWQSFWLTPEELPGGSPIAVVRERLFRSALAKSGKAFGANRADVLTPDETLALLIRAWNCFLADRKANNTRLQISRGKLSNDNFPRFLTLEEAIKDAEKYDREAERLAASRAAKKTGTEFSG